MNDIQHKYAQSFDALFTLDQEDGGQFSARFPNAWGGSSLACAFLAAAEAVSTWPWRASLWV